MKTRKEKKNRLSSPETHKLACATPPHRSDQSMLRFELFHQLVPFSLRPSKQEMEAYWTLYLKPSEMMDLERSCPHRWIIHTRKGFLFEIFLVDNRCYGFRVSHGTDRSISWDRVFDDFSLYADMSKPLSTQTAKKKMGPRQILEACRVLEEKVSSKLR